jgi:SAM-dependent methyltransferase
MYSESAALYDLIYGSVKDYPAEARELAELVRAARPGCRTVLDVACGTAEHARLLAVVHGFDVDGVDLDPAMVEIARAKVPSGRFEVADMADFHLGRSYDAVLCLFSSIGYVATVPQLCRAMACLREHIAPDGIVVVEPWFTPDSFTPGPGGSQAVERNGLRVTCNYRSEHHGHMSRLYYEYLIDGPDGSQRRAEVHEVALFTTDEMIASFRAAGLAVRYDAGGPRGLGRYVASLVR